MVNCLMKMMKESRKIIFMVCFHFSSTKENNTQVVIDRTQILVGETVRECLAALKYVQVQMHYI